MGPGAWMATFLLGTGDRSFLTSAFHLTRASGCFSHAFVLGLEWPLRCPHPECLLVVPLQGVSFFSGHRTPRCTLVHTARGRSG